MRKPIVGLVSGALLAGGVMIPSAANAAQTTQQLDCGDYGTITVRTPDTHSSEMGGWSVGQVVGGGNAHLIPTSFTFSANDDTTGSVIFQGTSVKGGGNANHNQGTVTCSQTMRATAD
ncbi:MAG: hypothetical protein ACTHMW_15580, partial [Actinomycetes bacterium]